LIVRVTNQNKSFMPTTLTQQQLFITMALNAWETSVKRTTKLFDSLTDEQLLQETAPGRNTGIYLLGHLTAVNDSMLAILGFGEKQYPELEAVFLTNPDKSGLPKPSVKELRLYWTNSVNALADRYKQLTTEDWFSRHMSVSEEDFTKEPHRNKLNIIVNRTNHMEYHRGQLVYLQASTHS
jgi:uncharacterized damage-inducible protein DinB